MMRRFPIISGVLLSVTLSAPLWGARKVKYQRDVRPILEQYCVRCHGEERASRGVRLDRKDRVMMIVSAKHPQDSRLYYVCKSGIMPMGPKKLSPDELETLRKWIVQGAR